MVVIFVISLLYQSSNLDQTFKLGPTCENCANSLSASIGMCPSSSWQQSLPSKQSQCRAKKKKIYNQETKKETGILTVRGNASEQRDGGCTACTETPGRPNCWGNLWPTTSPRPVVTGNRFSLQNDGKKNPQPLRNTDFIFVLFSPETSSPLRKADTSRSWGMRSSPYPQSFSSCCRASKNCLQARWG